MAVRLGLPEDENSCIHCGAHVTDGFRRVFGDRNHRVHRCNSCDSYARLSRGSAAGREVRIPDPETAEGRHGNTPKTEQFQ
ncbi:DUF7563 family protein [Haloprofundus halophilus]|uniref:DUF7563 family protein n=1 Tax=Haloprofundus halophilus TaxID=2283527 RepID=UPI000E42E49A